MPAVPCSPAGLPCPAGPLLAAPRPTPAPHGVPAQVLTHARVPIVKFTMEGSGISFDISFDADNGPKVTPATALPASSAIPPRAPHAPAPAPIPAHTPPSTTTARPPTPAYPPLPLQAAQTVKDLVAAWPAMKPLVLVLKVRGRPGVAAWPAM